MSENADNKNREQKTVLRIYAALCASILLSCAPDTTVSTAAFILLIGVMMVIRHLGRKAKPDSLTGNHMMFIAKTMWVISLMGAVTGTLAGLYLLSAADIQSLYNCLAEAADQDTFMYCINDSFAANKSVFIAAVVVAGGPLIVYCVYRIAKGLERAFKGYRVNNPKAWI